MDLKKNKKRAQRRQRNLAALALQQKQNHGKVIPDKRGRRQKITLHEALSEVAEDIEDRSPEVLHQGSKRPKERKGSRTVGVVPTGQTGDTPNASHSDSGETGDGSSS